MTRTGKKPLFFVGALGLALVGLEVGNLVAQPGGDPYQVAGTWWQSLLMLLLVIGIQAPLVYWLIKKYKARKDSALNADNEKRKVGDGYDWFLQFDNWGKIAFFPLWFPFFLSSTIFASGEDRKENQRLLKDFYRRKGFAPYAIELIVIGLIFCTIFYSMDVPRPGGPLLGWMAIRAGWQWALIIGIGYFLFKLLLLGISQASKAAKTDSPESTPPQAQDTTPPDDIETRLQRLEGLKEKGLLTDAEYQAKREEILGEV